MTNISVRMKPYDPANGYTARLLAFDAIGGHAFEAGRLVTHTGGRPLTLADAEFLRTVRVKDDPKSPLAFDVHVEQDEPPTPKCEPPREAETALVEPPKRAPTAPPERKARKEDAPQKQAEPVSQKPAEPAPQKQAEPAVEPPAPPAAS